VQFAESLGHRGEIAPEHDYLACPELDRAQAMSDAPPLAAHCQQIDGVVIERLS
jgi:hypothetical protein